MNAVALIIWFSAAAGGAIATCGPGSGSVWHGAMT
jgi:hypothetical protein